MTDEQFYFELEDRIAKIKAINEQYDLLHNSYIAFSGGKDSIVLSNLIDLALPNNDILRVYVNTGLDYAFLRKFVFKLSKRDGRIKIINNSINIVKLLHDKGYPFKSKQHSQNVNVYLNNKNLIRSEIAKIENDMSLINYDYISNLPRGSKSVIKYFFGLKEKKTERDLYFFLDCP